MFPGIQVTVSSRNSSSYDAAVAMRPDLKDATFKAVDINDAESIKVERPFKCGAVCACSRSLCKEWQPPCAVLRHTCGYAMGLRVINQVALHSATPPSNVCAWKYCHVLPCALISIMPVMLLFNLAAHVACQQQIAGA